MEANIVDAERFQSCEEITEAQGRWIKFLASAPKSKGGAAQVAFGKRGGGPKADPFGSGTV